jgi:NAD(P)-dependent dehydrogenase (short-subunit alcohol dehydrogenase family)
MPPLLILSGASRGIGRAIAERALERGMTVGALARTGADLASLAALAPERVEVAVADVRDQAAVAAGAGAAIARFGAPTLVVAAARSDRSTAPGGWQAMRSPRRSRSP